MDEKKSLVVTFLYIYYSSSTYNDTVPENSSLLNIFPYFYSVVLLYYVTMNDTFPSEN